MRLPRDVSGRDLAKALQRIGYRQSRQVGSHIRLTRPDDPPDHVTVPDHTPVKLGTLNTILKDVAARLGFSRDELLQRLFS